MEFRRHDRGVVWGMVLIAVGLLFLLHTLNLATLPFRAVSGPLVLGIPGLLFALVYANNRENWWAIIPGGVLLTLSLIAAIDTLLPWADTGWLFFAGLAATFGLVWRETGREQQWALLVALICCALVGLTLLGSLLRLLLPIALLGAGVYLLVRQRHAP